MGYLPREVAADYHDLVMPLQRARLQLQVDARTWSAVRKREYGRSRVVARVRVNLPWVDQLFPVNSMPEEPHVVVPRGSKVQVTREENHLPTLVPYLEESSEVPAAVALRSVVEKRPRSVVEVVQACFGFEPVGVLSPTQSKNLMPLVKGVEARGVVPVVHAELCGDATKEGSIDARRAQGPAGNGRLA